MLASLVIPSDFGFVYSVVEVEAGFFFFFWIRSSSWMV
jgi:hypothetical protein